MIKVNFPSINKSFDYLFDHEILWVDDVLLVNFKNILLTYAIKDFEITTLNNSYNDANYGLLNDKPVARSKINNSLYYLTIEGLKYKITKLKKVAENDLPKNEFDIFSNFSKINSVNSIVCLSEYSKIDALWLPREVAKQLEKNCNKKTIGILRYGSYNPRFIKIDEDIKNIRIKPDGLMVAVSTNKCVYFFDLDD